jgi:hypothetical protein
LGVRLFALHVHLLLCVDCKGHPPPDVEPLYLQMLRHSEYHGVRGSALKPCFDFSDNTGHCWN